MGLLNFTVKIMTPSKDPLRKKNLHFSRIVRINVEEVDPVRKSLNFS